MASFLDPWVVDKTFFEFSMGGSCACCGMAMFLPGGVNGLIKGMSDLETDAANAEIAANEKSPWPPEMREQVWSDRVRLRHKLKLEMKSYKEFWTNEGDAFRHWIKEELPFSKKQGGGGGGGPNKMLKRSFQMPRSEIRNIVHTNYNIHSAFGAVLGAVIEQVQHFDQTGYPVDAPSNATSEVEFEKHLTWDRRGGFTIRVYDKKGNFHPGVLDVWLDRMASLGGPKLLDREPKKKKTKKRHDDDDDDSDEEDDEGEEDDDDEGGADDVVDELTTRRPTQEGPSFRSDRRIVRLIIARYWADNLIQKYKASKREAEKKVDGEEK